MVTKILIVVFTLLLIIVLGRLCMKSLHDFKETLEWEVGDKFVYTYLNKDEEILEITAIDFDNELVVFKDEECERHCLSFEDFKNNDRIRRK